MTLFDLPSKQQLTDLEARVARLEETLTALVDPSLVRRQLRRSTSLTAGDASGTRRRSGLPRGSDSSGGSAHTCALGGLCAGEPKARAHFLQTEWLPFIRELRQALLDVQTKSLHNYSPREVCLLGCLCCSAVGCVECGGVFWGG
jgi:hypothetical protein